MVHGEWLTSRVMRLETDREACTDIVGMNKTPSRELLIDDGDRVGQWDQQLG